MSVNIANARGGEFATSRKGGLDAYELAFIGQKLEAGVPVSAIAKMLGRPVQTIRDGLPPSFREAVRPEPSVEPEPPPRAPVQRPPKDSVRYEVDAAGYLHKRQIPTPKPMPEWARPIAQEVADRHGVTVEQLTGLSRLGRIAHARQAAYAALRSRGQVSLYQIGCWFGGRDHSTIRAGILRHEKRATADLEAWRALGKAKAA